MGGAMDNTRVTLSTQVMLEIEEALNYPCFLGFPMGVTISDAMTIANNSGNWGWSWRSSLTHWLHLRYWHERILQGFKSSSALGSVTGRIVFFMSSKRVDLNTLILPLVEEYGPDKSIVLCPFSSLQAKLPEQTPQVLCDEFSKIDSRVWKQEYSRCAPKWRERLNQVKARHAVPENLANFLLCHLKVQSRRVMESNLFLDVINPKAVVTDYDRGSRASCLVLCARQRKIPVITMIHGALSPYPSYGYAPVLADYVCCWGKMHEQNLLKHGVDRKRLVLTGCQSMSRKIEAKKELALSKIGLAANKPVVLLATSPIYLEDRKKYTVAFCDAMSKLSMLKAIVRLHPSENISDYQELIDKFPSVAFLPNIALSRDESLAAVDLVVMHESGFGNEALLKGKLVVILDVLSTPLRMGREFIEMAGCPSARGSDELELVIRKIFADSQWKDELVKKAERYILDFCQSYGQEAINNVCRVIDHAIKRPE